ncbi:hypothetical protein [Kangiella sp. TOML190]|uniref:hypothetical protein n=1 Tax=Kangiella sp. TOML190 TaxID=2931351 RepID=UPI00203B2D4B|nr:hypothetical protein [Kangiella sp. TOML190]
MSGPKVVRIVTEEEKLAICSSQMAMLTSSIEQLLSWLEKKEMLTTEIEDLFVEKISRYQKIAIPENYRTIPAKVAKEIEFIKSEKKRYENILVKNKSSELSRKRNLAESIKTLRFLYEQSKIDYSVKLPSYTKIKLMNEAEVIELEKTVALEFRNLASKRDNAIEGNKLTDEQMSLIDRLKSTDEIQFINIWKKEQLLNKELEDKKSRLDILLAEIETIECEPEKKTHFLNRANSIYEEGADKRKSVLIDSLVIDLAAFVRNSIETNKLVDNLHLLKVQVESLEEEGLAPLSVQIDKAIESLDVTVMTNMEAHANNLVQAVMQKQASEKGRKALIKGLRSLGYSVNEQMQTALVENGQLVVRKNNYSDYGVEVRGVADTGKLQVRLVSNLPERERRRRDDIDAEEKWCSDFSLLRKQLSESGIDLDFQVAMKPGESIVKFSKYLESIISSEESRGNSKFKERSHGKD